MVVSRLKLMFLFRMVLSHRAVELLLTSDCQCMSVDSPDDMWLGICANYWMGQHVLHTNSFHQV